MSYGDAEELQPVYSQYLALPRRPTASVLSFYNVPYMVTCRIALQWDVHLFLSMKAIIPLRQQ